MQDYISEIWGWDEQWQRDDFSVHFDPQEIMLVLKGNDLVGYSHTENQDNQFFIRMVVVHPHHQRNRIGTKLLAMVIAAADKKSMNVGLEVFKINEVAKAFYEKHGFNVKGETSSSLIMVHA